MTDGPRLTPELDMGMPFENCVRGVVSTETTVFDVPLNPAFEIFSI
jgi:hypothetical protein